ncbi:MAG: GTPase RsgA, partial [Actinobacteria bacterium]|nr:GTPase RsgA [Actinomycetota bacterium]
MDLHSMGWDAFFEAHFAPFREQGMLPARVIRQDRTGCDVLSKEGRLSAKVAGKLFLGGSKGLLPTVGDWVAIENRPGENTTIIRELLPRKTRFSRKAAGESLDEQVVAANVDTVFLVSGLDKEFNIRRMERYLTLACDSGARPVIVLNKADLCEDV